ncbi:transporter substrate-binding domain-containing protein [Vibrio sp. S4M6]|uniref:transporter substrate-binding domain-containing protein n=1 Tax=Vibrio sinus TaxID=2946865 RepID=UPI00202A1BFF|nr:transporter substrate-binding domain-containing protein [Vibrio sinus]MCL9781200.1 transporter substrate-binding domain-containing protein [Vibrio sinus]
MLLHSSDRHLNTLLQWGSRSFVFTAVYLSLAYCLLLSSFGYAAQQVDIYTYDTLPPFAYTDEENNLTGVYIEIVKKIDMRMPDYDINFKVVPWARAKALAKTGKAFAILPPYFHAHDWLTDTEPKKPYLWPYSQPIFTQTDIIVCHAAVELPEAAVFPRDFLTLSFTSMRGDGRAGPEFFKLVKMKAI